MTTVAVLWGNSDDKLTQKEWAAFCAEVQSIMERFREHVHFFGYPLANQPWQNGCCVLEVANGNMNEFREFLARAAGEFKQDSIALVEAPGSVFVGPDKNPVGEQV